MFLFGIVLAILGALFGLPAMRERLAIDLAQQGDVFLALFSGVFVSTVGIGPVIDSYGNKMVMTISAVLTAIALAAFSIVHGYVPAIAGAFLLGFGGGGLNTAANALIADVYPENRGAMLNLIGIFFGAGATFIPLLAATMTTVGIPQLLLVAASLASVAAIAYAILPFPAPRERAGFSILASLHAAKTPGVLLLGVILLCESGSESSIGGWMSTYLGSLGASPKAATWVLAGFWGAMMAGRYFAAHVLKVITHAQLVLASAIGCVVGCVTLLSASSIGILALAAAIAGWSFAAVYPTILAMAADRYERMAGTIFGFLFAAGLVGGMFFPFAMGHISSRYGVRSAMAVPLTGVIAIAVVTLRLVRAPAHGELSHGGLDEE